MRNRISLIAFMLFAVSSPIQANTLQQDIDGLIEQRFPHATIGVFVKDAQSGQVVYQRNANKLLSPASNIKMFTAAAALYHLGPNDRYITSLSRDKNNIYIKFSGSPGFTSNDLKQLIHHLELSGVTTITGDIVLDTSMFKPPYYAAGSSYDDLGWFYDAPSTAIILNGNAVSYDCTSAKNLNKLVTIKPEIPNSPLRISNNVITVSKVQAKEHCSLNIDIQPNNSLRIYGCLAQEEKPQKMQFAVTNPSLYAKQVIQTTLKENHIVLKGRIIKGREPDQAKAIATHQSDELSKLLKHMLEESDNLYADSVTKRLGHTLTKEGTYKQGAFAIKQILAKHTHLDMQQLVLADGVGNRYNLITPKQMAIFLTDLYQDKKMYPLFINMLPRMGATGTLKDRMKKSGLENKILAKTGSMHDITALSGYMLLPTGKTIIFSIIGNAITGDYIKAKELEEKILLAVFNNQGKV